MDDIDRANDQAEKQLNAILSAHQPSAVQITGNGICIECGGIVKPKLCGNRQIIGRWCSTGCRNDWEASQQ